MFKKKSPNNFQTGKRESIQHQKIYGIEAKLQSMIQNGNKSVLMRQKQNKSRVQVQSETSSQISSQNSTVCPQQALQKNRLSQLNVSNKSQILRNGEEKHARSFEAQLKGLIKIIYQKEKQIEKLKTNIKEASQATESTYCKKCSLQKNQTSYEAEELGLNVDEIKETTQRIVEMEAKQEELHEVIDFLVKKEDDSTKTMKEISTKNKELISEKETLTKQLERMEKNRTKDEEQMERLRQKLKHQDHEILRLNTDIVNLISHAKQTQHELTEKINLISDKKQNFEDEFQKVIEKLRKQFTEQKQSLEYEIQNLRVIEEETKSVMREQEMTIEELQLKIQQEQSSRQKLVKEYQDLLREKDEQINELIQEISQFQHQSQSQPSSFNKLQADNKQLVRQNLINKSTIDEYKKLLEKLKKDMENQQKVHEKEIQSFQRQISGLEVQLFEIRGEAEKKQQQAIEQRAEFNRIIQEMKKENAEELQRKKKEIRQNWQTQLTSMQNTHTQEILALNQQLNKINKELIQARNQSLSLKSQYNLLLQQQSITQQKCLQLENQLTQQTQKLSNLQQSSKPADHIISLPTIQNISYIDLANSSFQCKLEQLVQFETRQVIGQEEKNNNLLQVEENSLQENSSYVRYQDNLIQELERQCNEPTEIFLNQDNNRTKLVQLSEARQSLKMTKEVNFQLFEEINRQEKIITEFKNAIRFFIQSQKQSVPKNSSNPLHSSLQKLENLLLLK